MGFNSGFKGLIILFCFHDISLVLHSFFLSYSGLFLPAHCSCRGLLQHLIILSDTLGMNGKDEGRFVTQTTNHNEKAQTSMNPGGFEPEILKSEGPRKIP